MADDPWAVLAIRAAVDGNLDFTQASNDPGWQLKELITLRTISKRDVLTLKSLIFQLHAASVQNISLAPGGTVISDIYKHHFKTALKRYNDIHKLLRPWDEIEEIKDTEPTPGSSMSSEEIANLIKKYKEIYKQEPVKDVQPV